MEGHEDDAIAFSNSSRPSYGELCSNAVAALQPGPRHNARKIARDIDRSHPNNRVDVIVQYKVTPTAKHYRTMTARGARVRTKLHGIKAAAFNLPVSALAKLEADSDIAYVTPDRKVTLKDNSSRALLPQSKPT